MLISRWDNQPSVKTRTETENRSQLESKAHTLASDFLSRARETGHYSRESIKALAEMAVSEDEATAKAATRSIFTSLVEPLADSFDPRAVSLYNRLFAQLIDCCRKTSAGRALDGELASFHLSDERDLFIRAQRLRTVTAAGRGREVKRVIVLSRVTLGADVAITSVIIERFKREFPAAEIVLLGARKAAELFGGDARLSFGEVDYRRAGTLIERLLAWTELVQSAREMTRDLKPDEFMIVDPDSRLTQLGLLPVADNYLFFPSREYGSETQHTLSRLAAAWTDELFGAQETLFPRISLRGSDRSEARALVKRMRRRARPIVAINFGVGENPLKRINDEFERQLVRSLIEEGASVILDKGAGEDETRRADAVIAHVAQQSSERASRVLEIDEASLPELLSSPACGAELLVWSGRIGLLAALIAESDLYIGYDSAGQHIAAAAGVACIDVFAGFSSPRFLDRWRPAGPETSRVIAVDTINDVTDTRAILSETLLHARELLKPGFNR
jgi:ADP-heptose:LPS heptosyltransferase